MKLEVSGQSFPFGEPIQAVTWSDGGPKRVVVVGVYPSAVHARWIGVNGKQRIGALAVANEPEPFWTGEDDELIVQSVSGRLPSGVGSLEPARLNGVSGKALDPLLDCLGLQHRHVRIIDLWNRYLANSAQEAARKREIERSEASGELQVAELLEATRWTQRAKITTLPQDRQPAFSEEFEEADPAWVVTLGEEPVKALKLEDLSLSDYGSIRRGVKVCDKTVNVIALAHTRQIAKHGLHAPEWFDAHQRWLSEQAELCRKEIAADLG